MIAALVLAAAAATASPAPSFAGVTLGESASSLVAQMGEPALTIGGGTIITYVYLARNASAMEDVMLIDNNVTSVTVWPPANWAAPSPAGSVPAAVALGATYGGPASTIPSGSQPLVANGWHYTIGAHAGVIDFMAVELPIETIKALVPSPPATLHSGTSPADAIVIVAPNESVGVRSEYVYLALSRCGSGGHWKSGRQALVDQSGRNYDRLDVTCSAGGEQRSLFFDITSYLGKM